MVTNRDGYHVLRFVRTSFDSSVFLYLWLDRGGGQSRPRPAAAVRSGGPADPGMTSAPAPTGVSPMLSRPRPSSATGALIRGEHGTLYLEDGHRARGVPPRRPASTCCSPRAAPSRPRAGGRRSTRRGPGSASGGPRRARPADRRGARTVPSGRPVRRARTSRSPRPAVSTRFRYGLAPFRHRAPGAGGRRRAGDASRRELLQRIWPEPDTDTAAPHPGARPGPAGARAPAPRPRPGRRVPHRVPDRPPPWAGPPSTPWSTCGGSPRAAWWPPSRHPPGGDHARARMGRAQQRRGPRRGSAAPAARRAGGSHEALSAAPAEPAPKLPELPKGDRRWPTRPKSSANYRG